VPRPPYDYADYADMAPPLDLPDDFGTDTETDGDGAIAIITAAILLTVIIAASLAIWSLT